MYTPNPEVCVLKCSLATLLLVLVAGCAPSITQPPGTSGNVVQSHPEPALRVGFEGEVKDGVHDTFPLRR
jgi:hypothetical protein